MVQSLSSEPKLPYCFQLYCLPLNLITAAISLVHGMDTVRMFQGPVLTVYMFSDQALLSLTCQSTINPTPLPWLGSIAMASKDRSTMRVSWEAVSLPSRPSDYTDTRIDQAIRRG